MGRIKYTAVQTAAWMAILTLISKFLGFIREMVLANYYGTSFIVDAYMMANAVPAVIFGGFFVAISTAYMPVFSKIHEGEGGESAARFTDQIISLLFLLSLGSFLAGFFFSDEIAFFFARGFSEEGIGLTSFFLKISFGYIIFASVGGILESNLQYKGVFLKPVFSGYFLNIAAISVIVISARSSYLFLPLGMLLGYGFKMVYLMAVSGKSGYRYKPALSFHEAVRKVVELAIPVFIGSCVLQINTFVDKTLASTLQEGSVAALGYGIQLVSLVTGLTASLIVTIIYPKISREHNLERKETFNQTVESGAAVILMLTVPFTLGALVFSREIVQVVYERGVFDVSATAITSGVFFFYSIGMVFFTLNDLLTKVYYSVQNMKAPIACSAVSVGINISLNMLLIRIMGADGLALATSVAACCNTVFLYAFMRHRYPELAVLPSGRKFLKIGCAAVVSVGLAYGLYALFPRNAGLPLLLRLGCVVFAAGAMYLLMLALFKVKEIHLLKQLVRRL